MTAIVTIAVSTYDHVASSPSTVGETNRNAVQTTVMNTAGTSVTQKNL